MGAARRLRYCPPVATRFDSPRNEKPPTDSRALRRATLKSVSDAANDPDREVHTRTAGGDGWQDAAHGRERRGIGGDVGDDRTRDHVRSVLDDPGATCGHLAPVKWGGTPTAYLPYFGIARRFLFDASDDPGHLGFRDAK